MQNANKVLTFEGLLLISYRGQTRFSGYVTCAGEVVFECCTKALDYLFKHSTNSVTCRDYDEKLVEHAQLIHELATRLVANKKPKSAKYFADGENYTFDIFTTATRSAT